MDTSWFHTSESHPYQPVISNFTFRERATIILDSNDKIVALFLPPILAEEEVHAVWKHMDVLEKKATKSAQGIRGQFKVITFGFQNGGGMQVN